MKTTTISRLLKLEGDGNGDGYHQPEVIFFVGTYPGAGPIVGWMHEGREYLRMPDETDSELEARAISGERPFLSHRLAVPCFFSIHAVNDTIQNLNNTQGGYK